MQMVKQCVKTTLFFPRVSYCLVDCSLFGEMSVETGRSLECSADDCNSQCEGC